MKDSISIPIPFNLEQHELVLDPACISTGLDQQEYVARIQKFFADEAIWDVEDARNTEVERIMRSAVCLWQMLHRIHHTEATFWECLNTAIIWERG